MVCNIALTKFQTSIEKALHYPIDKIYVWPILKKYPSQTSAEEGTIGRERETFPYNE